MYFISRSLLLKALGWSLVNSLWQMAFLWLLYILLTGTGSRFSAKAKHNLALILSTAGSLWFVFTLIESLANPDLLATGFTTIFLIAGNRLSDILFSLRNAVDNSLPFLSSIYLGGLLVLSLRYLKYYLHLRHTKLSGLQKIKPSLRLFTRTVSAQMGIRRKVSVWLSSLADSPMTVGFLRPVILIPIATINHLSTEQVESILLHELTHIKRNDYLVNLFVTLNGIVFFFNPFSRLFIHAIKKEREHCCDDVVMQFQYKPHIYASALLSLEKTRQHHQLAMAAVGRGNHLLLDRIRRVTGHAHNERRYNLPLICFFLFSVIMGFTLLIKPKSQPLIAKQTTAGSEVKYWQWIDPPRQVVFASNPPKEKSKKIIHKKANIENIEEEPVFAGDVQFAKNVETENDGNEDNNIATADQTEEPSSFSNAPSPSSKKPDNALTKDYPYVPNSSFSFQLMTDPAKTADKWSDAGVVTNKNMQEALTTLNTIDWNKIEKKISKDVNNINIDKLNKEIRKSIVKMDIKINENVVIVINKNDEKKIRENLRQQLITLNNFKLSKQPTLSSPNSPSRQMRLQRDELKKQFETMKKAQEVLKKKVLRITYI